MKTTKYLAILFAVIFFSCESQKDTNTTEENQEVTEVHKTDIVGEEITYSSDSVEMNGYIVYDKNSTDKKPGVLVVHEWWGHNEYARKRAEMLAELGYVALAVDMYGNGKQAKHPEDAMTFAGSVMKNFDGAKLRFKSAMETLKNNPHVNSDKIGAIGYCFGGGVVLAMANAGVDLDAVAAFHGTLQLPVQPTKDGVKAKVLVLNGADDPFVTAEQIEAYKKAMKEANADYEYIAYEGAKHSFTNKGADENGEKFDLPLAYNAEADSASWNEMKQLFAKELK